MRNTLRISITSDSRKRTSGLLVRENGFDTLAECEWPNEADSKTIAAALRKFADDLEAAGVEIGA